MQRLYFLVLFGVVLLLSVSSCKLESLEDPIIVADVEKEFFIDLWEELSPERRSFILRIETIEKENCLNYDIDYQFDRLGSNLQLSINEIVPPDDCTPGESTVAKAVSAGQLNGGLFEISIDLKNTAFNDGQLTVSSENYRVELESETGIILVREELQRVPEKTIWGYAAYHNPGNETKADDFISGLEAITVRPSYRNGYYGYFTINDDGADINLLEGRPATDEHKAFIFNYTGDKDQLLTLLEEYRQEFGDEVILRIYTSEGEEL